MKTLLLLFLILIFSTPSFAKKGRNSVFSYFELYNNFQIAIPEQKRAEAAENFSQFLFMLNKQLPTLSPSQKEWINKQLPKLKNSSYISKTKYIENTPEFSIWNFRNYYLTPLTEITMQLVTGYQKNNFFNSNREIFYWAGIASFLSDRHFYSYIAYFANKKFFDSSNINISSFITSYHIGSRLIPRSILDHIIGPYFKLKR